MKALILSSSLRRNGNSTTLAGAVREGLIAAGHTADLVYANDFLNGFLRDCRQCRMPNGECAIQDDLRSVFLTKFLPADGFIAATPIHCMASRSSARPSSTDRSATTPLSTRVRPRSSMA